MFGIGVQEIILLGGAAALLIVLAVLFVFVTRRGQDEPTND